MRRIKLSIKKLSTFNIKKTCPLKFLEISGTLKSIVNLPPSPLILTSLTVALFLPNEKTLQLPESGIIGLTIASLSNTKWTLAKDTTKIGSLTCYKATTILKLQGRRGEILRPVTAWYTKEINISAGPDGFGGLPGLIIQLEINNVI